MGGGKRKLLHQEDQRKVSIFVSKHAFSRKRRALHRRTLDEATAGAKIDFRRKLVTRKGKVALYGRKGKRYGSLGQRLQGKEGSAKGNSPKTGSTVIERETSVRGGGGKDMAISGKGWGDASPRKACAGGKRWLARNRGVVVKKGRILSRASAKLNRGRVVRRLAIDLFEEGRGLRKRNSFVVHKVRGTTSLR